MKKATISLVIGSLLAGFSPAHAEDSTNPPPLCVMTYNLRFASPNPPNAWPARRPLVREVIQSIAPDVMGTQEGVYAQLKDNRKSVV